MRVSEGYVSFEALEELLSQIKPDARVIHAESLREWVEVFGEALFRNVCSGTRSAQEASS